MQILVKTSCAHEVDASFAILDITPQMREAIADARDTLKKFFLSHGGNGSLIIRGTVRLVVLTRVPGELEEFENHDGETCARLPGGRDWVAAYEGSRIAADTEADGIQVWAGSVRLCTYLKHTPIVIDSADFSELLTGNGHG